MKKIFSLLFAYVLVIWPLGAASVIKSLYGTSNQAITITLTSLGNTATQGSAAIDNTSNLYLDALVFIKVKTNSGGTTTGGTVNVYAYGTADGGTTYTDGITGTNAGQTLTNPPNVKLIGICNTVANSTTYNCGPFAVSPAFGGVLPDHWGIAVNNLSGNTLDASVGSAWYQGIQAQIV